MFNYIHNNFICKFWGLIFPFPLLYSALFTNNETHANTYAYSLTSFWISWVSHPHKICRWYHARETSRIFFLTLSVPSLSSQTLNHWSCAAFELSRPWGKMPILLSQDIVDLSCPRNPVSRNFFVNLSMDGRILTRRHYLPDHHQPIIDSSSCVWYPKIRASYECTISFGRYRRSRQSLASQLKSSERTLRFNPFYLSIPAYLSFCETICKDQVQRASWRIRWRRYLSSIHHRHISSAHILFPKYAFLLIHDDQDTYHFCPHEQPHRPSPSRCPLSPQREIAYRERLHENYPFFPCDDYRFLDYRAASSIFYHSTLLIDGEKTYPFG